MKPGEKRGHHLPVLDSGLSFTYRTDTTFVSLTQILRSNKRLKKLSTRPELYNCYHSVLDRRAAHDLGLLWFVCLGFELHHV